MSQVPPSEVPVDQRWTRRIVLLLAMAMYVMVAQWILEDPANNLQTDWTSFDNTADRLFSGEEVYQRWHFETEPLPFLYPPFVLWLAAPMRLFGFYGSWVYAAVLSGSTFILGVVLATRSSSGTSVDRTTALVAAVATGSLFSTLLIGQYSGIYVLAIGLAIWLWRNERHILAGLALAILVMKPNIGIAVPVVLLWSRSWRQLQGFVLGVAALLMLSLPFGLGQWSNFVANVSDMGSRQFNGHNPDQKMVTLVGGFQTVTGLLPTSPAAIAVWAATAGVMGIAILTLWTKERVQQSPQRALASLAIFVIVANPRMFFYDGSLAVVGVLMLWLERDSLGDVAKRWITPASVALWVLSWGGVFPSLNRFVGLMGAVVLVAVAADALTGARTSEPMATDDAEVAPLRHPASVSKAA